MVPTRGREQRNYVTEIAVRIRTPGVYSKEIGSESRCGSFMMGFKNLSDGNGNGNGARTFKFVFVHGLEIGGVVQRDSRGESIHLLNKAIIHPDKLKTTLISKSPKIRIRALKSLTMERITSS